MRNHQHNLFMDKYFLYKGLIQLKSVRSLLRVTVIAFETTTRVYSLEIEI